MATVAQHLRAAREEQKLSINQVAEITKIRTDHLRALEEGNYNVFSATVYIRGFVRGYAKLLKLDVPQVMAALDAELGRTDRFNAPPPLSEESHGFMDFITLQLSKFNWRSRSMMFGGLAVLISITVAVAAWVHHKNSDPLGGLKPAVYQPKTSGDTLPVPPPRPTR